MLAPMTLQRPEHGTSTHAVRSSETRFAKLAEAGIVGVCIGSVHGDLFEANDAFLSLIGFSRNEFDGGAVKWSERTPPEWADSHRRALDGLKRTGAAQPWEAELIHKSGRRVPVIIGIATLDYPNTIALVTDLTSLRHDEGAVRRAEHRLQHAQKMEALMNLAGGVAHDFNNLLSVILGYTGMLAADLAANDPMLDILDEIRAAGERAAALTRQLLTFSRHQLARAERVDLNELVASSCDEIRRVVGDAIEVVTALAPSLPAILSEPENLREALVALAVNARDAMPNGGTLRIETASLTVPIDPGHDHVELAAGAYAVLIVSDTGAGMDRATQARMFEPFFTTKGVGEGTGLGLSTVFGIVQRSGGSIRSESALGKGAAFQLYFPAGSMRADSSGTALPTGSVDGTETILVVGDDAAEREAADRALRRHGYTVLEAATLADAILECERHAGTIHLVLTDVILPATTGREAVERLRAIRPEMSTLYTSGYTATAVVRHGIIGAGAPFLQKPFSEQMLARAVRRALDAAANPRATNDS